MSKTKGSKVEMDEMGEIIDVQFAWARETIKYLRLNGVKIRADADNVALLFNQGSELRARLSRCGGKARGGTGGKG